MESKITVSEIGTYTVGQILEATKYHGWVWRILACKVTDINHEEQSLTVKTIEGFTYYKIIIRAYFKNIKMHFKNFLWSLVGGY